MHPPTARPFAELFPRKTNQFPGHFLFSHRHPISSASILAASSTPQSHNWQIFRRKAVVLPPTPTPDVIVAEMPTSAASPRQFPRAENASPRQKRPSTPGTPCCRRIRLSFCPEAGRCLVGTRPWGRESTAARSRGGGDDFRRAVEGTLGLAQLAL